MLDQASRVQLCELTLTLEQFAEAVTGLGVMDVDCISQSRDPRLGVESLYETRETVCTATPDRKDRRGFYTEWLKANAKLEDGCESSFYLGAQGSIRPTSEGAILRYGVRSWPQKATASSPE